MSAKLLLFFSVAFILLLQPTTGYSTFVTRANSMPHGHRSYRPHHYHHYHSRRNDRFFKDFFRMRNKNITDWGAFFDCLCIGPAGAVCGIAGMAKREDGAGLVMALGVIETAVAAVCLSR